MEDDSQRTVWCGNLSDDVTEEILYELFLQAAPLERVRIPQDNKSGRKANYAFITCKHVQSVPYVVDLLNGIQLYEKRLNIKARNQNHPMNSLVQPQRFNMKERIGKIHTEIPRVDMYSPFNDNNLTGSSQMELPYLMEMGELMNAATMHNQYDSMSDNRYDNQRHTKNMRENRKGQQKPYGRNNRHGRFGDRNNQRHRRFGKY